MIFGLILVEVSTFIIRDFFTFSHSVEQLQNQPLNNSIVMFLGLIVLLRDTDTLRRMPKIIPQTFRGSDQGSEPILAREFPKDSE